METNTRTIKTASTVVNELTPLVATSQPESSDALSHEEDPLLNLSQVARLIGKHPSTVQRWARDGLLKVQRMPSNLPGVRRSEVNKFLGGSALDKQV